jgi:hypothetical protein
MMTQCGEDNLFNSTFSATWYASQQIAGCIFFTLRVVPHYYVYPSVSRRSVLRAAIADRTGEEMKNTYAVPPAYHRCHVRPLHDTGAK